MFVLWSLEGVKRAGMFLVSVLKESEILVSSKDSSRTEGRWSVWSLFCYMAFVALWAL